MKRWFSLLTVLAFALALVSPAPASAQTQSTLSVSLYCSRDYNSHYCTAYPGGGNGSYSYEWRWYGQGSVYPYGSTLMIYPTGCNGSTRHALVVVVTDSAGASGNAFTYIYC